MLWIPKLAAFDNDGTLHPAKGVWNYLQEPLGLFDSEGKKLLKAHLAGELAYAPFVEATIARWAGRPERDFITIIQNLPLREGTTALIRGIRSAGARWVVISSGVHWWKNVWRDTHGITFDEYRANLVDVDAKGICTGKVGIRVTDDSASYNKGTLLREIQKRWGFTADDTLAVGDGPGDIPLFSAAGRSFSISPTNAQVTAATTDGELVTGGFQELLDRL